MSMPIIERPENPVDRGQSVSDLIESVALVETGLSHILNAEGEKIQKVIKYGEDEDVPIEDIINVNDSVEKMVGSISRLEMMLQNKLDIVKDLDDTSTIMQNAYMFGCARVITDLAAPYAILEDHQILHNFTANDRNNQFTTRVAGTYLISVRATIGERSGRRLRVSVNGSQIPASIMDGHSFTNTNTTTFLYHLAAGDTIALNIFGGAAPIVPAEGIVVYLCAVKLR